MYGPKDAQAHGLCTRSKGVRHGDGVVEVDGVRCVELIDDVCVTAALTKQREEYMVNVADLLRSLGRILAQRRVQQASHAARR